MGNIVKALKGVASLDDIRAVFEIDHPLVSSTVEVTPDPHNRSIEIAGQFIDRKSGGYAGKFVRRLDLPAKHIEAYHGVIELEEPYFRNGIAAAHYSSALQFYRNALGVRRVYMEADYLGPYIWGDFGFEFGPVDWALMMTRFDQIHIIHCGAPPRYRPSTATGLVHYQAEDGFPIGEEAIRAAHAARGTLKMVLDFNDNRAIQILTKKGILRT